MYAKYIKQEIADLNGTGHTQAYYKMKTQTMSHDVSQFPSELNATWVPLVSEL